MYCPPLPNLFTLKKDESCRKGNSPSPAPKTCPILRTIELCACSFVTFQIYFKQSILKVCSVPSFESQVRTQSPRDPQMPPAEICKQARSGLFVILIAQESSLMVSNLLSKIFAFLLAFHLKALGFSPARLINTCLSFKISQRDSAYFLKFDLFEGFHFYTFAKGNPDIGVAFRERIVTYHPFLQKWRATYLPIKPLPPAITTLFALNYSFSFGTKLPRYLKKGKPPKNLGNAILPSNFQPVYVCSSIQALLGNKNRGIGSLQLHSQRPIDLQEMPFQMIFTSQPNLSISKTKLLPKLSVRVSPEGVCEQKSGTDL